MFDVEAVLSGSDSGDEVSNEDLDRDLEGFIDDATQQSQPSQSSSQGETPIQYRNIRIGASPDEVVFFGKR